VQEFRNRFDFKDAVNTEIIKAMLVYSARSRSITAAWNHLSSTLIFSWNQFICQPLPLWIQQSSSSHQQRQQSMRCG